MPRITYVSAAGERREVEVPEGFSVMEGAIKNGVSGIVAECGGACACATCHVYVDAAWRDKLLPVGEMEEAMLDFADDRRETSRLSCQIKVTSALDGLVVETPAGQ